MTLTRITSSMKEWEAETVADLLANTTLQDAVVAGVYVETRKEGFRYEVAASAATDHHLTTAGGVKLYVLANSDATYSVAAFGAVGDGVTDDHAILQSVFTFVAGTAYIVFEKKTYAIEAELDMYTGTEGPKVIGNMATIKATAAMTNAVSVTGPTKLRTQIRDLQIDANNLANYGFKGVFITEQDSQISGMYTKRALIDGTYMDACQAMLFLNNKSDGNGGDGFLFESCNAMYASSLRAVANGGKGATVQRGATNYSGGMWFDGIDLEVNDGGGLHIVDTLTPVIVTNHWIEANDGGDGVLIGASTRGVSITNGYVTGDIGASNYRAVRVSDGAYGVTVRDNNLQTSGSTAYAVIEDENTDPSIVNTLHPNYYATTGKILETSKGGYNGLERVTQVTTVDTAGMGGYLSGGEAFSIPASGSQTFVWQPSGTFNIGGTGDRGAYLIEIDFVGSFSGYDQSVFKRYHVFGGAGNSTIYDGSTTEVYGRGDGPRGAFMTGAAPTVSGVNGISVVFSNADTINSYDGYFTWRVVMTTKGQLDLTVS